MKYRKLGKTGLEVSEISLGTWQLGGVWGDEFSDQVAQTTLKTALDNGINFFDTADVYRDGLSEKTCGSFKRSIAKSITVATKCGRRLNPHTTEGYNKENIEKFVSDSIKNMGLETIDLIQLHCPPTDVFYHPEVFQILENLVAENKIKHYGVSVGRVEEGLKALEYPNLASIQIIFNIFRQRPMELLFKEAKKKNVGIIVRVPLASGLLSGKFTINSTFGEGDHRFFNRKGDVFDNGETFAGVDFELGLKAVEKVKQIFDNPQNLAPYALRWILMQDAVSCIIPGASKLEHVKSNVSASDLPTLSQSQMDEITEVYEKMIKPSVHDLW